MTAHYDRLPVTLNFRRDACDDREADAETSAALISRALVLVVIGPWLELLQPRTSGLGNCSASAKTEVIVHWRRREGLTVTSAETGVRQREKARERKQMRATSGERIVKKRRTFVHRNCTRSHPNDLIL